ncbi:MAG: hypothetical protein WCK91_00850 [bacterium]
MESVPKQEQPISPEEFFATRINMSMVTTGEFYQQVKAALPGIPDEQIMAAQAMNFKQDDKIRILLRKDARPPAYLPYLETHEKWEAYVANKSGYNLLDKASREYKEAHPEDISNHFYSPNFLGEIKKYNYDFRHEYAIYKEYEQAQQEGKLEEYHRWFMALRAHEREEASPKALERLENDVQIRESIYKKLTQNSKHSFLRRN